MKASDAKAVAGKLVFELRHQRPLIRQMLLNKKISPLDDRVAMKCIEVVETLFMVEDTLKQEMEEATRTGRYTDATPCPIGKTASKRDGKVWYGVPLGEVDPGYLKWVADQSWAKDKYPQLVEYVERAINGQEELELDEENEDPSEDNYDDRQNNNQYWKD